MIIMTRRLMLSGLSVLLAAVFLPPFAFAQSKTPFEKQCSDLVTLSGKKSEHDRLWQLFDLDWKYDMSEYPEWATAVGYPGQNGRWTDMSLQAVNRRKEELDAPLQALKSIDRSKLDSSDQLNYDLMKYRLETAVEGKRFPDELLPINQLEGVQLGAPITLLDNPHATLSDYQDIISRLRNLPVSIDQNIALMKEGLKKGITPPKLMLAEVPQQIKAQMITDEQKAPLLEQFRQLPASIPESEQTRLKSTAADLVKTQIAPAYGRLYDFFVNEYYPACRTNIAFTSLPDGQAWYAHRVLTSTTTKLSPQEIHNIGMSEVRRLRGEMDKLIASTGFKGGFKEFCEFLRTDPRFFYKDADSLLVGYRDIAKRIDPELIRQFGKLPRLPYGVKPVPAFSEKSQPTAYYQGGNLSPGRPGIFYANTYDLKSRPKWEMEALTLHEAVPGHHLQISLAQEMENMPEFRKHSGYNAYTEGWGLYAESLGKDLGMYEDAYYSFGQLTYETWRSIRLVLDTGIHSLGWSRQQAIDFFKENSAKPEHDIAVEVDRYIVWPGQALGYKMGQITIRDLREHARQELGDCFDVRAFHDKVLSMGAVPLDFLKSQVNQWIIDRKTAVSVKAP